MTVGMSAPPMGMISITPKTSAITTITGNRRVCSGWNISHSAMHHGRRQHRQVDDVLPSVGNGPLRQHFLQLARGDQAAGEGQRADNHFQRDLRHLEFREVGNAHVIFGNADHRRASAPKAWLRAVRCGTAVMGTRPSGMPTIAPTTSATMIHLYSMIS